MPYADPVKAAESSRERCRRYYAKNRTAMQARGLVAYRRDPARSHRNSAAWRAAHPEAARQISRREHLRRTFGLTPEAFDALVVSQDNACAGCLHTFTATPHIDHDHATGEVRGLLCRGCNTSLGQLREDPTTLRRLAAYLEKSK